MACIRNFDGKEVNIETFFEFNGIQINVEDLVERTRAAYLAAGNGMNDVENVKIYINANERRAYYIVNGEAEGRFVEF